MRVSLFGEPLSWRRRTGCSFSRLRVLLRPPFKRSSISAFNAGYDQAFRKNILSFDHRDVFAAGTFGALDPCAKLGPQFNWFDRANPGPQFDWIANRTLYGVTMKSDLPSVSLASWLSGDLQKGLNTLVSENFAGRELLIRIFNQTLYSAFHKSYMIWK